MRRTTTDVDDTELPVDDMLRIESEIDNERRSEARTGGARAGGARGHSGDDDDDSSASDVDTTFVGTLSQTSTASAAARATGSNTTRGAAATPSSSGGKGRRQGQGSRGGSNPPRRMGDPNSHRESIRRHRDERLATVFTAADADATIMNEIINSTVPSEVNTYTIWFTIQRPATTPGI
jgi:hypothetical protein